MQAREYTAARVSLYPQMMALASGAILLVAAVVYGLEVRPGFAIVAGGLAAGATVVHVVCRRIVSPRTSQWLAIVPLLDIVAVGFQRGAFIEPLPLAGLLFAIPLAWLAFAFPLRFALAGAALVVTWPFMVYVSRGTVPGSWQEVVGVVIYAALGFVVIAAVAPIGRALSREEARAAERARTLEAVLAATADSVILMSIDGRVQESNRAGWDLLHRAGLDEDAEADRPLQVYAGDRRTPVPFSLASLAHVAAEATVGRTVWIGEPGDQLAVRCLVAAVNDDDPSAGVVISAYDVTELMELIEIRDVFVDAVAHELRTPLTVLFGLVDQALEERNPHALRGRIDAIDEALSAMRDRVDRLLLGQRGTVSSMRDSTDVSYVIEEVISAVAELAEGARVSLHQSVREVPTASINVRTLSGMLTELVKNAIYFNTVGGSVQIRAYADERGRPTIDVIDTGIGMSSEERRRAFDRFYRSQHARSRGIPGAGLGLSLVASLAARSDVQIELSPNSSGGTTASLVLPIDS